MIRSSHESTKLSFKKGKCSHEFSSACGKQTELKLEKSLKWRSFVMADINPRVLSNDKRIWVDEMKFYIIGIFWNLIGQFTYKDF